MIQFSLGVSNTCIVLHSCCVSDVGCVHRVYREAASIAFRGNPAEPGAASRPDHRASLWTHVGWWFYNLKEEIELFWLHFNSKSSQQSNKSWLRQQNVFVLRQFRPSALTPPLIMPCDVVPNARHSEVLSTPEGPLVCDGSCSPLSSFSPSCLDEASAGGKDAERTVCFCPSTVPAAGWDFPRGLATRWSRSACGTLSYKKIKK